MKLNPFSKQEIGKASEILKNREINHSVVADENLARQKLDVVKNQLPNPLPTAEFDPSCHFIEIDDADGPEVGNLLEKFGIVVSDVEPDFTAQDYICRKCGYTTNHPGDCPKHGERLTDFATYSAHQTRANDLKTGKLVFYILFLVVLAALYAYFFG